MDYILLFIVVFGVNILPAFAPPTWILLVYAHLNFNMPIPVIVLIGAIAATLGRAVLAKFIGFFAEVFFNERQKNNLEFLGKRIGKTKSGSFLFIFLYSLTPLSTSALFVAAGIAKIKSSILLLAFFLGRLLSYTFLLYSSELIAVQITDIINRKSSPESLLFALPGLILLFLFFFIDWRELLEFKRLKLNFKILKWQEEKNKCF